MQTLRQIAKYSTGVSQSLVSSSSTASSVPMAPSSTRSSTPATGGTEYSVEKIPVKIIILKKSLQLKKIPWTL